MLCPIGQSNEKLTLQVLAKWWEYVTPYHFVHILSHKRYGVFPRIFV